MKVDLFCHQSGHTDELCLTKLLGNTPSSCTHCCSAPVRKRVLQRVLKHPLEEQSPNDSKERNVSTNERVRPGRR